ncbi:alpha/beta hydrolase family protein [Novosphingobium decolorationis]|nr:alpha/beta fold hydrolase [Novosphingobium decolorationis]
MTMGSAHSRRMVLGGSLALAAALAARPVLALDQPARATRTLMAPGGREVSVSEWVPEGTVRGTILFSHGAGSAPWHYDLILAPWIAAGYHVLAPLHVDSREHPRTKDFPGLASWKTRIEDMRLLIAAIGDTPFIAAGHSYGGLVATTLGGSQGVAPEGISAPFYPRLAKAVVAFSPPAPVPVLMTAEGYGKIAVPALIQTGTIDNPPSIDDPESEAWKGHLAPFDAAAEGGNRYGLVLQGANHYFGGIICDDSQPGPPQLAQIDLANRYVGLFLEAYGQGDAAAKSALDARITDALPARLMAK